MTTGTQQKNLRVADEAWVALALLHRENPKRESFSSREIIERVKVESGHPDFRPGIAPHVSLHNVANLPANSARYRMFYRTRDSGYRLFRAGDDYHSSRSGKTKPDRSDLPERYHGLLDWYETSYCGGAASAAGAGDDPFLRMRGVGKEIWAGVDPDEYVADLRAGWDQESLQQTPGSDRREARREPPAFGSVVWDRLVQHEGEDFKTKTGLSFTYELEGRNSVWFVRDGRRVPKRLSRGDLEKALQRLPLQGPADIKDCFDPSYLYGLLVDSRIVSQDR